MRAMILAMLTVGLLMAGAPNGAASPSDPDADDWVSIAISPQNASAAFGSAGDRDRAIQIAMDECGARSKGTRCVDVQTTEYGCVGYVLDKPTQTWAGGRGPDKQTAVNDAAAHLSNDGATYDPSRGATGVQCSSPVTPP